MKRRLYLDKCFTVTAYGIFGVVALVLLLVLGPILLKGARAVVFRGTVEFRRLQFESHDRGDAESLQAELAASAKARQPILDMFNKFRRGLDTEELRSETRKAYREYGREVRRAILDREQQRALRNEAKVMRDAFQEALESTDKAEIMAHLDTVLAYENDARFKDTACRKLFALAREYRPVAETVNFDLRETYLEELQNLKDALKRLYGPFPDEPLPTQPKDQYGATRMDRARICLKEVLYAEEWYSEDPDAPLQKRYVSRAERFAGTPLEAMFPMVEESMEEFFRPKWTVYWRYLSDKPTFDRFFGGIWPDLFGTLLLTVLAILFAVPLGIISAAYLIECGGDNVLVMIIRTCINTLAGVPSIVFGLFGLAFFVLWFLPMFGITGSSALAGALTLALLVLPIVIRASEEAIRSVPHAYKEAALSLGAGRFRTFVTVTLPAASPGIMTGIILAMSRAAGETAPILFTAAAFIAPMPALAGFSWTSVKALFGAIFRPVQALPYTGYFLATGDNIGPQVPHKQYGIIAVLVILVLMLNLVAILLRARISKKLRGQ